MFGVKILLTVLGGVYHGAQGLAKSVGQTLRSVWIGGRSVFVASALNVMAVVTSCSV